MSKSMTVQEWLSGLDEDTRIEVGALREIIQSSHDELTEHLKWNAPSFCHHGEDRVTMGLNPKGGFRVVFHRGARPKESDNFSFEDADGLARWPAPDRAVVSLADGADIEAKGPALSAFVRRWVEATR